MIYMGAPSLDRMSPGGTFMAAPVVRFGIDFAQHSSVGPGKIRLLEAIRDCGSLSQGARSIGMSYRRAWLLVESLKQSFREPVTVASTGGKDGGGMLVTEFGEALIKSNRELEREFEMLAARRLHAVIPTVVRHLAPGSAAQHGRACDNRCARPARETRERDSEHGSRHVRRRWRPRCHAD